MEKHGHSCEQLSEQLSNEEEIQSIYELQVHMMVQGENFFNLQWFVLAYQSVFFQLYD